MSRENNIKTETEKDLVEIAELIKNTQGARDNFRAEGERLQQQGLLLISQCAGTMVEILKHVKRQENILMELSERINTQAKNIKFLYEEWEFIKHGKENI